MVYAMRAIIHRMMIVMKTLTFVPRADYDSHNSQSFRCFFATYLGEFCFFFVILQIIQVLGDKYPCYLGQYMYSERSEKDFFAFVFRFLQ